MAKEVQTMEIMGIKNQVLRVEVDLWILLKSSLRIQGELLFQIAQIIMRAKRILMIKMS